jgi:BirA family biotin operon repressor/biotin-[acetyl-CoA-carboxylase] ligase
MSRFLQHHFDLARIIKESSIRHVEYHEELESTNTMAIELLGPLLDHSPALVLTGKQTAGRGRKGNSWWSSTGALTFTVVIDAHELQLDASRRPLVALASGLAVRDVLHEQFPDGEFQLKWPNDVLTANRKICGILVEQHGSESRQGILIGIGININNSLAGAPSDVFQRATSLYDLTGHSFDLTDCLIKVLQRLDFRISQFSTQPRLALSDANRHNVLNGRVVSLQVGDDKHSGECHGIDEDGQLVLQTQHDLLRINSGVVLAW